MILPFPICVRAIRNANKTYILENERTDDRLTLLAYLCTISNA